MCLCDGEMRERERGNDRAAGAGQALCHVVTQMDRSKHWIASPSRELRQPSGGGEGAITNYYT